MLRSQDEESSVYDEYGNEVYVDKSASHKPGDMDSILDSSDEEEIEAGASPEEIAQYNAEREEKHARRKSAALREQIKEHLKKENTKIVSFNWYGQTTSSGKRPGHERMGGSMSPTSAMDKSPMAKH